MSENNEQPRPRLTTERLKFFAMSLAQRELARVHGLTGGLGTLATSVAEENAMARELLELRREVEQLSADRYAEQQRREAAEARIAELERERDEARKRMAAEIARHRLAEHERAVAAQDVQEIPSPPLGRELGRSPISTPRRQERAALLSIVRASCEVDTVRKAALALLGEVQS